MRLKRSASAPAVPVVMSGRQARKLARAGMAVYPPGVQPVPSKVNPAVPGSHTLRQTGGFRFRRHLVPFAWLALLAAEGFTLPLPLALVAGAVTAVLTVLLSRHLSPFAKFACASAALLTLAAVPTEAAEGITRPWPVIYLAAWLAVAIPWLHHYRWRPVPTPEPVSSDVELWNRHLAVRRLRDSWLAEKEALPNGRRWTVMLPPGELEPRQVMSSHALIAGVWDKPMTEVFPEPYPDGRQSRCLLTILERDTLATVREWDGGGIGADGVGALGRFADGTPARIRILVPRDGTRHGLVAGTSGGGKTYLLNLLIRVALQAPFPVVPVVLDPQEGQSLPQWRDKVLYAAGVGECAAMLRGLHAGMMDRSRYLGSLEWDDEGHQVRGTDFYDPVLFGLPVVMPIIDEAPVLLTDGQHGRDAVRLLGAMAKLARKTGLSLWPVAQVPSLAELGDQVVRSMLRGGNVVCLRTGDSVSSSYLGLEADPSSLPPYFADGSPTAGLGYLIGPDQRQAPFRADLVPARLRHAKVQVPALDDRFAAAMASAMRQPVKAATAIPALRVVEPLPDDDAPEGRKAVDAVWAVLPADGSEVQRGQIIKDVLELVTKKWGREPFVLRSITTALEKLTAGLPDGRQTANERHGFYCRANPANYGARAEG